MNSITGSECRPFQFTLRRLLMTMAYASAVFAVVAMLIRMWQGPLGPGVFMEVVFTVLGGAALCILIGAGIGELTGDATAGALHGIGLALTATLLAVLILVILPLIFGVVFWHADPF